MSALDVIVATIGKAHGLRGEVALNLRTDQPEERLQPGTSFEVEDGGRPAQGGVVVLDDPRRPHPV